MKKFSEWFFFNVKIPGWVWFEVWRLRGRLAFEAVILCLLACIPIISARLSQYAIDDVIMVQNMGNLNTLLVVGIGIVGIVLVLKYTVAWVSAVTRQRFVTDVRCELWEMWLNKSTGNQFKPGDIANRILGDVYTIGDVILSSLSTILVSVISLCFSLWALFKSDLVLAWIAVSFVPGYVVFYFVFGKQIRAITHDVRTAMDRVVNFIMFRWEMFDEIHTLQGVSKECLNFKKISEEQFSVGLRSLFLRNLSSGVGEVMMVGWGLALFIVGSYFVLQGKVSLGGLIAIQMLAGQLLGPVQRLLNLGLSVQLVHVSLTRISEVGVTFERIVHAEHKRVNLKMVGESTIDIKLEDVVCYSDDGDKGRVSLDLHIPLSTCIYLTGSNGSGKSSICRIIAGIRAPAEGGLLYNGQYIDNDARTDLLGQVLLLTHVPYFFSGTLRENLVYGLPYSVTDVKIFEVLEQIGLRNWVEALTGGLDFMVSDRGKNLSNGQCQRLQCVRALLRRTQRLIIVDEALSGVCESDAERILAELGRGRSLIVTRVGPTTQLVVEGER